MKQVRWTDRLTEEFISRAALSEEEAYIMRSRARGVSVVQQAMHLHKSESSIARAIRILKKKYDCVQKESPDIFPERKKSAQETWMDTH